MTIVHPKDVHQNGGPYIFAHLLGISCSVCAPDLMTLEEVETYATVDLPPVDGTSWHVINKAALGLGSATPNACNIEPAKRMHWFLMSSTVLKDDRFRVRRPS